MSGAEPDGMRIRVKFRYRAETGEVEVFTVETVDADARAADHEARHDQAAAEVARIVEPGAAIEAARSGVTAQVRAEAKPVEQHTDEAEAETERNKLIDE